MRMSIMEIILRKYLTYGNTSFFSFKILSYYFKCQRFDLFDHIPKIPFSHQILSIDSFEL